MEINNDHITITTRPKGVPVTIRANALDKLPTAVWARGRSGTMKALSRWALQRGELLVVKDQRGNKLLKQVMGTPEEEYDPVARSVGSFANVRDPSIQAIRNKLPAGAWSVEETRGP